MSVPPRSGSSDDDGRPQGWELRQVRRPYRREGPEGAGGFSIAVAGGGSTWSHNRTKAEKQIGSLVPGFRTLRPSCGRARPTSIRFLRDSEAPWSPPASP
jgi:hypothetical protein